MKIYKRLFTLLLLGSLTIPCFSQETLTLRKCVEIARENSLLLRQAENSVQIAAVNYTQSRYNFLPSVNGGINVNKGIGPTVDNFNLAITESPVIAQFGLGASLTLFGGLVKYHNFRSRQIDLAAAQFAGQDIENDLLMNVVLTYFAVVFDGENLQIAGDRLALLNSKLEQEEARLRAGTGTEADLSNVRAQLAVEKVGAINAQNQYDRDLMGLLLLLNVDPSGKYSIEPPDLSLAETGEALPGLAQVLEECPLDFPGIKEKEMRIKSAELALKSSIGNLSPTLSIGYQLGSRYSSALREQIGVDPVIGIFPIYGEDVVPFGKQFDSNFNQSLTMGLTLPIFNNYRVRQGIEQTRINLSSATLALETEQQQVKREVQQAWLDARAARTRMEATLEQLTATSEAFGFAEKRYQAGQIDFFRYMESLNIKTRSETEQLRARYDHALKMKILDFYRGKGLETLLD